MDFGRSLLNFKLASYLWSMTAKIWEFFIFLDVKILKGVRPDTMISERRDAILLVTQRPVNILSNVLFNSSFSFLQFLYEIRLVGKNSL